MKPPPDDSSVPGACGCLVIFALFAASSVSTVALLVWLYRHLSILWN